MNSSINGQVLFDVGAIALGVSDVPGNGTARDYLEGAVFGEFDAVFPHAAIIGAHHIMTEIFGYSNSDATYILTNLFDSKEIEWRAGPCDIGEVNRSLNYSAQHNFEGWDGYYCEITKSRGISTILGQDDDFDRVDGLEYQCCMTDEERSRHNDFLNS